MKKIVKLNLILLMMMSIIFCTLNIAYAKTSSNVAIVSASEVQKGEEFTVKFNLSNLKSNKGINALMGTLKYDKDSLTLVKMEGQNGWATPSYNEENGKFVTEISEYVTKDESFLKITFKVKEGSKNNINISMENVSVANEDEEVKVDSKSKSITVKANIGTSDNNTGSNTNTNTNTDSNTNSNLSTNNSTNSKPTSNSGGIKNGTLPNTGADSTPFIIITILIILLVVLRIRACNKRSGKRYKE